MRSLLVVGTFVGLSALGVVAAAQDPSLLPAFGSSDLAIGFMPDPITVSLTAGGDVPVPPDGDCNGHIASAPDYVIEHAGGAGTLNLYFIGDGDTTLYVQAPEGGIYCSDDTNGANPMVSITDPLGGTYFVWVGTYAPNAGTAGTLYISEMAPQW